MDKHDYMQMLLDKYEPLINDQLTETYLTDEDYGILVKKCGRIFSRQKRNPNKPNFSFKKTRMFGTEKDYREFRDNSIRAGFDKDYESFVIELSHAKVYVCFFHQS